MKTIIAGSRSMDNYQDFLEVISFLPWEITTVISGKAPKGADVFGEKYAYDNKLPIIIMKAKWKDYGIAAGCIRNEEMAVIAEALFLYWDGISSGSADMLKRAKGHKLEIFEWSVL